MLIALTLSSVVVLRHSGRKSSGVDPSTEMLLRNAKHEPKYEAAFQKYTPCVATGRFVSRFDVTLRVLLVPHRAIGFQYSN
jgi:hypothetical protein